MGFLIMTKSLGNFCVFFIFSIFNFILIGMGGILMFFGVYDMAALSKTVNILSTGLVLAGLVTLLIGFMGFCTRKSKCGVNVNLFLLLVLLCGYITITVFYWMDKACQMIHSEQKCKEIEEKVSKQLIKWVMLAADATILFGFILGCFYRSSMDKADDTLDISLLNSKEFQKAKADIEKGRELVNERRRMYVEKFPVMAKYVPT
eukprot:TRINITY_DN1488_c0_g1_i1.p1 TRINITY_DN1488_c0_g1~~TRINITY_DN1488_c0_g1_i1.p1  ORF type:complete len:204 (+),score=50.77 TRINITY_DN1488_c0_g1_i1:102-713(+)